MSLAQCKNVEYTLSYDLYWVHEMPCVVYSMLYWGLCVFSIELSIESYKLLKGCLLMTKQNLHIDSLINAVLCQSLVFSVSTFKDANRRFIFFPHSANLSQFLHQHIELCERILPAVDLLCTALGGFAEALP